MKLELKVFDLSDEKTFFKKLKEMTKFHGAKVGKIKTTNIFITKNSRQELKKFSFPMHPWKYFHISIQLL